MNEDKLAINLITEAKQYWKNIFSQEFKRVSLTNQHKKSNIGFNKHSIRVSGELFSKLERITRCNDISIYTFLVTTLEIQLYKYTSQSELLIGIPVYFKSNKSETVNKIMPFKSIIGENNTFKEQLINVKNELEEIYRYQVYPINEIVKRRNTEYLDKGYSINIAMKNIHNMIHINYMLSYEDSEINFLIDKKDDYVDIELIYNTSLISKEFILEFGRSYLKIFDEIISNLQIPIRNIDILLEEEKRKILVEFNDTKLEYPKDKTIYELFEEQVEKTPENIALVYEEKELSYKKLNERANQLARVLRKKGVGPDKIVGIMVERSLEMIVGIMGILKAGGAYLPIDPDYPNERIEYMLEDSKTDILLTQTPLLGKSEFGGCIIEIDKEELYVGDSGNLEKINTSNNLAYVIYTSGSTGKPKGVMIEHQNVNNFIIATTNRISMNQNYNILALTTISFDIFLLETLLPLSRGMKIIVVGNKAQKDSIELNEIIEKNNVNIIQVTPSRVKLITNNYKNLTSLSKVEKLLIGGEALQKNLLEKLSELKSTEIFNMYGPTETTVWSTIAQVIDGKAITIGKPISNTRILIVDKNNKLQPVGIAGELCISGDGLARGYLNRPDLTEEKFVSNPYEPGEKMYKTGDLARWMPDGNIEFIGRIDNQVKIRGFRIELGEIESQLLKHQQIKDTVVIDRQDKDGDKYLCAYVVSNREITITELREHLSKELPDYMIPAYFIQLENIPLTPNGKIDRKALPEPEGDINTGVEYIAPRNEIEEKIVKVWNQVLRVEKIGIDDNFFALGGTSLKAIQIVSTIHMELNSELPVSELFNTPTIRQIGEYIRNSKESIYTSIEPAEENEVYEVSSVQKRIYALNQFAKEEINYNIPSVMIVEGNIDRARIAQAFKRLVERYESLRTSFEMRDGDIVQRIHKETVLDVEYSEIEDKKEVLDKEIQNFIRPFDLSKAPL
ncbi:MAG: amino acid adenylation domain-containing protein, partial [Bacillota bacterium]|nr:amino acid adenylation domain-containing protein [Bacillota bacterium]